MIGATLLSCAVSRLLVRDLFFGVKLLLIETTLYDVELGLLIEGDSVLLTELGLCHLDSFLSLSLVGSPVLVYGLVLSTKSGLRSFICMSPQLIVSCMSECLY